MTATVAIRKGNAVAAAANLVRLLTHLMRVLRERFGDDVARALVSEARTRVDRELAAAEVKPS